MNIAFSAIAAYLLVSISFAIVFSRLFRLDDPRSYGSGNPGATNVLLLTLLGDCAKGWVAVGLAVLFNEPLGLGTLGVALVALAVFAGHLWPVYHGFQGGKGVATALGVLFGIHAVVGVATLCTWLIMARATRYSSLSAIISAFFAPVYYWMFFGMNPELFAIIVMSVLLIYRHRGNIANLMAGKESRIGQKKESDDQAPAEDQASAKEQQETR